MDVTLLIKLKLKNIKHHLLYRVKESFLRKEHFFLINKFQVSFYEGGMVRILGLVEEV